MPTSRRFRVLVLLGPAALFAIWAGACSGSDGSDGSDADLGADAGQETSLDTNRPDTSYDTSQPDTGPADTGPQYDAGEPVVLDGGDLYEAGIQCVVGGELEVEPNDDESTANVLNPSSTPPSKATRCGAVLLTGDGGTPENDFLTFHLQPTTTNFYLQYQGNIKLTVTVDGSAPVVSPFDGGIPFNKNDGYYVEVNSANTKAANWRVTLFEN